MAMSAMVTTSAARRRNSTTAFNARHWLRIGHLRQGVERLTERPDIIAHDLVEECQRLGVLAVTVEHRTEAAKQFQLRHNGAEGVVDLDQVSHTSPPS